MAQSEGLHHAVVVYGADWCGDTTRTRQFLTQREVEFNYYNIEKDAAMKRTAAAFQDGGSKIPVVDLGEGNVLIEPTNDALEAALHQTGHLK